MNSYKTDINVKDDYGDEVVLILWDQQAKKEIGATAQVVRDKQLKVLIFSHFRI